MDWYCYEEMTERFGGVGVYDSLYSNDGIQDGDHKQYNENGELQLHHVYKNGKFVNTIVDNTTQPEDESL